MCLIVCQIFFHLRVFDYIVAQECRQTGQADELVEFVEMHIHSIHTFAFKEIAFTGERFNRRIPSK